MYLRQISYTLGLHKKSNILSQGNAEFVLQESSYSPGFISIKLTGH